MIEDGEYGYVKLPIILEQLDDDEEEENYDIYNYNNNNCTYSDMPSDPWTSTEVWKTLKSTTSTESLFSPTWSKAQRKKDTEKQSKFIGKRSPQPHIIHKPIKQPSQNHNNSNNNTHTMRRQQKYCNAQYTSHSMHTIRVNLRKSKKKQPQYKLSKSLPDIPTLNPDEFFKQQQLKQQQEKDEHIPDGYCIINYTKCQVLVPLRSDMDLQMKIIESNKYNLSPPKAKKLTLRRGVQYRYIQDFKQLSDLYVFDPYTMDWSYVLKLHEWDIKDDIWGWQYNDTKFAFKLQECDLEPDFNRRGYIEIMSDKNNIAKKEINLSHRKFTPILVGNERFDKKHKDDHISFMVVKDVTKDQSKRKKKRRSISLKLRRKKKHNNRTKRAATTTTTISTFSAYKNLYATSL